MSHDKRDMNIPINQEEANLIHYALEAMAFKRAEMAAEGMRSQSSLDRSIAASNEREAKTYYRLANLFRTELRDGGQTPELVSMSTACVKSSEVRPPMTKPIYDAPIKERLENIISACQMALECLEDGVIRPNSPEELTRAMLNEDEIAVCDWIIRPRFRNRKP